MALSRLAVAGDGKVPVVPGCRARPRAVSRRQMVGSKTPAPIARPSGVRMPAETASAWPSSVFGLRRRRDLRGDQGRGSGGEESGVSRGKAGHDAGRPEGLGGFGFVATFPAPGERAK